MLRVLPDAEVVLGAVAGLRWAADWSESGPVVALAFVGKSTALAVESAWAERWRWSWRLSLKALEPGLCQPLGRDANRQSSFTWWVVNRLHCSWQR